MTTFTVVDQITRERHAPGVDHGGVIIVLAKYGPKELWRSPAVRHRNESFPGQLDLVGDGDREWRQGYCGEKITLCEGVRDLKRLLREKADAINKFFGCAIAQHLDPKITILAKDDHA